MMTPKDIALKVTKARTELVLTSPFFGSLILGLKMVPDPSQPTAWVDGRSIGYNPGYVAGLSHERLTGLLAHEVMHVAMGHPWRRDARSPKGWNIACDKAINGPLADSFTLPEKALYPEGDEVGKSAEWIFSRLPEDPEPDQDGDGDGDAPGDGESEDGDGDQDGDQDGDGAPDPLGEVRDAPTDVDRDGEPAPSEQEWKERTAAAALQAQAQGNLPAGVKLAVDQAQKPKLDPRALLLRFFSERSANDYSWTRPNPRYLAQGLYLPGLQDHSLGEVAIMVDTSGSIDAVALAHARSIIESVIEECAPSGVTIYYTDAQVCGVDYFAKHEPLEWRPKGGGGTDFTDFFEVVENDPASPVCAICISDLYATFPDAPPSLPVLWLSTTENRTAPFGETVYID